MEVRNLIKPNAVMVQITEIGVGDIYKRLEKPSYGEPKIMFGSVIDVLNNGEEATLVALEFIPETYGSVVNATVKVFNGQMEVALFPATVDEYRDALADAIVNQTRAVNTAEQDFTAKRSVLDRMQEQMNAALTSAPFKEIQA